MNRESHSHRDAGSLGSHSRHPGFIYPRCSLPHSLRPAVNACQARVVKVMSGDNPGAG